jgi:hypothetical protein
MYIEKNQKQIYNMIKKTLLFIFIFISISNSLFSGSILRDSTNQTQITTSEMLISADDWSLKWSGYTSTDIFWDTRKPVEARDGGIFLYPSNLLLDVNGVDLNDRTTFNFITMNTRLTLKFTAPKALGANVSGMIEGWFMGVSNDDLNGFALRHSFIKLDWSKTQLLIGQTWHPMFTERIFPQTVSGSAGAPFQPFSRAPQVRFTQQFGRYSNVLLYANTQRDMVSDGIDKKTTQYIRNSATPELGAQYIFDFKNKVDNQIKNELYLGFGIDYKTLVPRLKTENNVATDKSLHSLTGLIFAQYVHHLNANTNFGFKFKTTLSQNTMEFLMMGGYAIKEYAADSTLSYTYDFDYTNLNVVSTWFDIYLNYNMFQIGLLTGYAQNLGSKDPIQDYNNAKSYFGTLYNAAYVFRLSPRIKYKVNNLQFCFEPEYTEVLYGTKLNQNGIVDRSEKTNSVSNIRFLFTTILFF